MGGVVSSADDNDELVDNLVGAGYIKTPIVEKALRCVDRGHYYLEGIRSTAYRDLAWKHGFLHLSAPCIYAEVLECLDLKPGLSFLNLGSGTGYLSTVAGFLLGTYGVNYGIELNKEAVEYANMKLKSFIQQALSLDFHSEFCSPKFLVGNCLQLDLAANLQTFDRVYCGAAVPAEYIDFVRNLVKIGGIVVLPHEDQLLQIKRLGENSWDQTRVLPVSFATMIVPTREQLNRESTIILPPREPLTLLEICRAKTRKALQTRLVEEKNFNLRCLVLQHKSTNRCHDDSDSKIDHGDHVTDDCDGSSNTASALDSSNSEENGGTATGTGSQSRGGGGGGGGTNGAGRRLPYYRRILVPLLAGGSNPEEDNHAFGPRNGGRGAGGGHTSYPAVPIPHFRWARFFESETFQDFFENQRPEEDDEGSSSSQRTNGPSQAQSRDGNRSKKRTEVLLYKDNVSDSEKQKPLKIRFKIQSNTNLPQPSTENSDDSTNLTKESSQEIPGSTNLETSGENVEPDKSKPTEPETETDGTGCSSSETLPNLENSEEKNSAEILPTTSAVSSSSSAADLSFAACFLGGFGAGDFSAPKRTRSDSEYHENGGLSSCKRSANYPWGRRNDDVEGAEEGENEENKEEIRQEGEPHLDESVEEEQTTQEEPPSTESDKEEGDEWEYEEEEYEQQQQRERMRLEREHNTDSVRQISAQIRDSIHQLPLPESLKSFLNYSRQ